MVRVCRYQLYREANVCFLPIADMSAFDPIAVISAMTGSARLYANPAVVAKARAASSLDGSRTLAVLALRYDPQIAS